MVEIVKDLLTLLILAAIFYGLVCFGTWMFSVQFNFEFSFLLSACVAISILTLKYIFGGNHGQG